jgi:CHAD domain-containing protein
MKAIILPKLTSEDMATALAEGMPAPGICTTDALAEAGRKIWRFQMAEMLRHEAGTRLGQDIEALHVMRVATRRMRAAFEIFGDAFEPDRLKLHLRGLRMTGRALGAVRDLDVFLEKAHGYLADLPESEQNSLDLLLEHWQVQRDRARRAMLEHLDSKKYALFKEDFYEFVMTPGKDARHTAADQAPRVCEAAPILIYSRLGSTRAFAQKLHQASYVELHMLRIEFKKLRYAVEFFREVLGETSKEVINTLKKMQDHLGELNDAHVAIGLLEQFLQQNDQQQAGLPLEQRRSAEGIARYLAHRYAERHALLYSFPDAWVRFIQPEFRQNLALAVAVL